MSAVVPRVVGATAEGVFDFGIRHNETPRQPQLRNTFVVGPPPAPERRRLGNHGRHRSDPRRSANQLVSNGLGCALVRGAAPISASLVVQMWCRTPLTGCYASRSRAAAVPVNRQSVWREPRRWRPSRRRHRRSFGTGRPPSSYTARRLRPIASGLDGDAGRRPCPGRHRQVHRGQPAIPVPMVHPVLPRERGAARSGSTPVTASVEPGFLTACV
jgi:hypothetical protein